MVAKWKEFWGSLDSQQRLFLGLFGAAIVLILMLGFKNAGTVFYDGEFYDAGSLFVSEQYISILDLEGAHYINQQAFFLRMKIIPLILLVAGGASYVAYRLLKDLSFVEKLQKLLS